MSGSHLPLVHLAHQAIDRLVRDGFHPVIIGKRSHVEVRGMTEDLSEFDVVLCEEDIQALQERPKFGIAAQTTQPIDNVRELVEMIRHRFPASEVRFVDTVCQPTKQRQAAAIELAHRSDVVIVIGGAHSNNTCELSKHANCIAPEFTTSKHRTICERIGLMALIRWESQPAHPRRMISITAVERWLHQHAIASHLQAA